MYVSEMSPDDPRATAEYMAAEDVVTKARNDVAEAKRLLAELIAARPATPAYMIANEGPRRDA
jgi:hypothetical protein